MTSLLFVDDDARALEAMQRQLAFDERWEVRIAAGAEEGLAALRDRPADIVLTDMRLAGTDGAEFLRRVQMICPRSVRIIHSAQPDPAIAQRALPVAHQFLTRACDPPLLLRVLEDLRDLRDLFADEQLQGLVGSVKCLPTRPRVYLALTEALQDSRMSMGRVADIVSEDAGIAGRVLQLANSAFFGRYHRTTDLREAVSHIGFATLHSMVAACEILGALASEGCDDATESARLVARLARIIGTELSLDEAFTAAVLRDLGVLIVRQSDAGATLTIPLPSGCDRVSTPADCAALGFSYTRVGAYLLALWGLPTSVVRGVLYHAEPWVEPAMNLTSAGVVHVADILLREESLDVDEADRLRAFTMSRGVAHRVDGWREAAATLRTSAAEDAA